MRKNNKNAIHGFSNDCIRILLLVYSVFQYTNSFGQVFYYDSKTAGNKRSLDSLQTEMRMLSDSLKNVHYTVNRIDLFTIDKKIHAIPDGYFDVFRRENGRWENLYKGVYGEYNFGSTKFIIDGKLYSCGGSGFWRDVHTIIGFLPDKGEWELLKFSEDLPKGIAYTIKGKIRIIGQNKAVTANLSNGVYETLPRDSFPDFIIQNSKHFLETQNWLLTKDTSHLFITSKNQNNTYSVPLKETPFLKLYMFDFLHIYSDSITVFSSDGKVHNFIISEAIPSASIMSGDNHSYMIPILALSLCSLFLILWSYHKNGQTKEQPSIQALERKYKGNIIVDFIPYRGQVIDIERLDELLGVHAEANPDSRKYKRAQMINEVNDTFIAETKQPLIIRERDKNDGRKYVYRIM
jgi:hypothetical protein